MLSRLLRPTEPPTDAVALAVAKESDESDPLGLLDATMHNGGHVVSGVGVWVGNDVGAGVGVGVTRRVLTSDPARLKAILKTTSKLIT
ncbi:MAG: hypothetical protein PVI63_07665 [Anaerolineae bacterium]